MQTIDETQITWHEQTHDKVLEYLNVNQEDGLSDEEANLRLEKFGANELVERGAKNPWKILLDQLTGVMTIVLIAAAAISALLSDWKDALVILAIVIINALLGFVQEYRAEQALAALKRMAAPQVRVRRNGIIRKLESKLLVPGDIILLEAGDAVPADGRLFTTVNFRVQESALTGESEPVNKSPQLIQGVNIPLGDRRSMVYLGTAATFGHAEAVVTATGMKTELGRIADLIQGVGDEKTPLQRRMDQLSKSLALLAGVIIAIVFVIGLLREGFENIRALFLTAVAMAVAAIPEGLPAVVTIALALGAQRMLRRGALIRKLPAVETLGSVTVICSDKTGTLTQNRMSVRVLDVAGHTVEVDQETRSGRPFLKSDQETRKVPKKSLKLLLLGGVLCNDAILQESPEKPGDFVVIGDPTEGALLTAAASFGFWKENISRIFPRVTEAPFSSERKRMTTVHALRAGAEPIAEELDEIIEFFEQKPYLGFVKGAVDGLVELSDSVMVNEQIVPMDGELRERILSANNQMAGDGLRVLGVCIRQMDEVGSEPTEESLEKNLVFVGLTGMMDPPRPEVKEAVQTCREAGIRPIMITGDHPLTALRIAKELEIATSEKVISGQELELHTDDDLAGIVQEVSVYARVSPEHKLRIVQALQKLGHIVAMTGDGVNDAPALRKSDIGVAMGITGTDVSKEAADMVILDDNFATIVKAVEEGRTIYDNIRKFIQYTMASNAGEIYVMLLGPFIGLGFPLTALQILWINLVTDGLPGLALGVEQTEREAMKRPPYLPNESVFSRGLGWRIAWSGLLMGLVSLVMGYWAFSQGYAYWQTMVFTTLTLSQMGNALAIRSFQDSTFKIGFFSNRSMIGAVLLTFVLQMLVIYWEPLQSLFGTQALPLPDLLISLAFSTLVFWAIEIEKWLQRRRTDRPVTAPIV